MHGLATYPISERECGRHAVNFEDMPPGKVRPSQPRHEHRQLFQVCLPVHQFKISEDMIYRLSDQFVSLSPLICLTYF